MSRERITHVGHLLLLSFTPSKVLIIVTFSSSVGFVTDNIKVSLDVMV